MRIAIVYDNISSYLCGANISTLRFANLLKKRGHKVIFISSRYKGSSDIEYFKGIKTYRFFSIAVPKTDKKFFLSFPAKNKLKEIFTKEKIQIMHFMTPVHSANVAIQAAKELDIKIVAHSHTQPENIFLSFPKIFANQKLFDLTYRIMIKVYKKALVTICPSPFAEKCLKKYEPRLNTAVISNGVEEDKFKKVSFDKFLNKHGLNKTNRRLLYIGRLFPEKNVGVLIRAMPLILKENKYTDLIIVGEGTLKEELKKLANELGVSKNVHFPGRISDEDLIQAYNCCNIFILPSIAELEGMVVLEAMACGKQIIISDSKETAAKDFVRKNGFVFKTMDEEDLAEKANKILSNRELEKKMANESLRESKEYNIQNSVKKLEKIYYSLLK